MPLPPLLKLKGEKEYRDYFIATYVKGAQVLTSDGIVVDFYPEAFEHAFYRDTTRDSHDKGRFDRKRAERMNWIRFALLEKHAEVYRRDMRNKIRRITLLARQRYAVITQLNPKDTSRSRFITAYIVDSDSALAQMRSNPKWYL